MVPLMLVLVTCCIGLLSFEAQAKGNKNLKKFSVKSESFSDGAFMPQRHSCRDEESFEPNVSPALTWSHAPQKTKTFALIMDDPDAPDGTWDHWIVFNIPATVTRFSENADIKSLGARSGNNSWGKKGYGGPCPPSGTHRYFFKVYALDTELSFADGAEKAELLRAMQGHILATAQLMGLFAAPKK